MVILQVVCVNKPSSNGVINAVNEYVKYEKKKEKVAIFNIGNDISNYIYYDITVFQKEKYNLISELPNPFDKPDLVVFNEVYKNKYLELYKDCLANDIPYVIIPHGCLVKKAQSRKKIKKLVANFLFFNRFINNSQAIQYLNDNEQKNSILQDHYSFVSGNGITKTTKKNNPQNKNFVYIGRYDVKVKGLDLLLKVATKNQKWFMDNNVKIVLYGRNSANGYEKMKEEILKNGISNIIILNDAIYGKEKEKVLLNSYGFIQVSRHEGQPMGIMEALSFGLPCIVTYGTSFGDYVNNNACGIGINFSDSEVFDAIKKLFDNEKIRTEFANNAKKVIEKDYEWSKVIKKCIEFYKKLV